MVSKLTGGHEWKKNEGGRDLETIKVVGGSS